MKRFRWTRSLTGWAIGAVGTGLAVVTAAHEHLGFRLVNSLLILVIVGISVLALFLSAIGKDVDEDLDQLQTDVNDGFDRVVDTLDAESEDVRADGGGATPDRPRNRSRDTGPTGCGAIFGMLTGGAVGTVFGPGGTLVGGLVGGLLGNEAEYRSCLRRTDDGSTRERDEPVADCDRD